MPFLDIGGQKTGALGFGGGLSGSTFSDIGGAVSDLFAADAYKAKAAGAQFERQNYLLASDFATQNVAFTEQSTAIKEAQLQRENMKVLGAETADVAGAGFAQSGSAIDLLRESAGQGALTQAVLARQGLITEAGYKEQAQSYQNMASAAQVAIDAENKAAETSTVTGIIKGAAAIATLL